jgi:hypothetical protein
VSHCRQRRTEGADSPRLLRPRQVAEQAFACSRRWLIGAPQTSQVRFTSTLLPFRRSWNPECLAERGKFGAVVRCVLGRETTCTRSARSLRYSPARSAASWPGRMAAATWLAWCPTRWRRSRTRTGGPPEPTSAWRWRTEAPGLWPLTLVTSATPGATRAPEGRRSMRPAAHPARPWASRPWVPSLGAVLGCLPPLCL